MNDFLSLMKSELALTAILFLLLFIKLSKGMSNAALLSMTQVLLLLNFIFGFFLNKNGELFGGMYYTNELLSLQKNILNLGVYLISLLFADWFLKSKHLSEFFILLLSAQIGMFFMLSSGNLLMFFLALELSTIPVAAMANFDLEKRTSSEAAMKMILSSAFSSGILLFGISLLYGATGTISFSEIPRQLDGTAFQVMAFVFLFTAFAFKLSIVPFHLWTADVYEGSPIAATSFLSVISKGSVAFVFVLALYKFFYPLAEVWYNLLLILSIHYDHREFVCIKTAKHQEVSCFFVHRPSGIYSRGNERKQSTGCDFSDLFYPDLYFFKPGCIWCGGCHFIQGRQRKC